MHILFFGMSSSFLSGSGFAAFGEKVDPRQDRDNDCARIADSVPISNKDCDDQ
jgi:hypothetical protein